MSYRVAEPRIQSELTAMSGPPLYFVRARVRTMNKRIHTAYAYEIESTGLARQRWAFSQCPLAGVPGYNVSEEEGADDEQLHMGMVAVSASSPVG